MSNRRKSRDLRAVRDSADSSIKAVNKARTEDLYHKLGLSQEAVAPLQGKVSDEIILAIHSAAAECFHEQVRDMQGENRKERLGMTDEEILDDAELGPSGRSAVETAKSLGVVDPTTIDLIHEFGMRVADFCCANGKQGLPI